MLDQPGLGLLLDDGGEVMSRLLGGVLGAAALALLLAVAVPIALLGSQPAPFRAVDDSIRLPRPAAPVEVASPRYSSVVDVARRYLGVPYVFGGTNPATGLDCSGLVQLVYRQVGVQLPRTAQLQFNATARVGDDRLQPGDLVFFARTYPDPNDWVTHVGIYIGGGQQINAPTTGQVVSIQPVFSGFWGAHFIGGGRVRT